MATTACGGAARAAFWLGLALLAAALLNGIGPWLRRTGLVERERYERFWDVHTGPTGFTTSPLGLGRRCVRHRSVEEGGAEIAGGGPAARYVLAVRRWEVPLKALKDVVVLALVAASLAATLAASLAARRRGAGLGVREAAERAWPLLALAALVAGQAAAGLARGETLEVAAGLRGFGFVAIALTAGWATGDTLRRLVPWFVGLLALQLALAPLEYLRGIPVQGHLWLFGEYFARRASGTCVMPNSIGALAAAVVGLAEGFAATRRLKAAAWGVGGLVVLASGSATALVVLAVLGAGHALSGTGRRALKLAVLGLGIGAAAWLLVAGRPNVLDSFRGRAHGVLALGRGTAAEVLVGRGLGVGTNAAAQLRGGVDSERREAGSSAAGGESAVSGVGLQAGLVGVALLLAALAGAFARGVAARPLALALGLACLTLNVTEAFPINVLLGLLLAADVHAGPTWDLNDLNGVSSAFCV